MPQCLGPQIATAGAAREAKMPNGCSSLCSGVGSDISFRMISLHTEYQSNRATLLLHGVLRGVVASFMMQQPPPIVRVPGEFTHTAIFSAFRQTAGQASRGDRNNIGRKLTKQYSTSSNLNSGKSGRLICWTTGEQCFAGGYLPLCYPSALCRMHTSALR